MHPHLPISVADEILWLHPEKAVYWPAREWLIVSDLHLGKAGHFRQAGIAVPTGIMREDLIRLTNLILQFKPKQLVVTGDMCHSKQNVELQQVARWRSDLASLPITLIRGNHDILPLSWYEQQSIHVIEGAWQVGPFQFIHDPSEPDQLPPHHYEIAGHWHPGIVLKGLGKQSLRFPCFFFGPQQALLPAFGGFTGTHPIRKRKQDRVIAILPPAQGSRATTNRLIEL